MEKKVTGQRIRREETLLFNFRVKFYPETVEDEIIQNSTLTLFYAQVNFISFHCPTKVSSMISVDKEGYYQ